MSLRGIVLTAGTGALGLLTLGPLCYLLVNGAVGSSSTEVALLSAVGSWRTYGLFLNTLILSCAAALLGTLLGVANAAVIHRLPPRWSALFTTLLVLPLVVPPYVHAVTWIALLGRQGLLSQMISAGIGGGSPPFGIYGVWGCGFVLGLSYFPICLLLTIRGFRRMDADMEGAAALAAGEARRFFRLRLPLAAKDILLGAVVIFVLSFGEFSVPALLRVNACSVEVFTQFSAYYDFRAAAVQSVPMIAFVLGVWIVGVILFYRDVRTGASASRGSAYSRPAWWIVALPAMTILVSAVPPFAVLLRQAAGLGAFSEALRTAGAAAKTSIAVSAGAAAASAVLAFFLCSTMHGRGRGWTHPAPLFALLGLAMPPAVVGIGLIGLCNRPGALGDLYGSPGILVAALTARFCAFAIIAIYCALESTDLAGERAAEVCGITWHRRAVWLHAPVCLQAAAVGGVVVFIFSVGELGASILVSPPGHSTAPIRVFSLLHYGQTETAAALCLIMACAAMVPIFVYALITNKMPEFFQHGQNRV